MFAPMTSVSTLCTHTLFRPAEQGWRGREYFALNRVNFVNFDAALHERLAPPAPIRKSAAHD